MDKIYFEDIHELANLMLHHDINNCKDSSAVLYYDDAVDLITELQLIGDAHLISLDITHPDVGGYNGVYYVDAMYVSEDEFELFVCPAKKSDDATYVYNAADVIYVDGDAESCILKSLDAPELFEITIEHMVYDEDDEECGLDCDECPFSDIDEEDDDDFDGIEAKPDDADYFEPLLDLVHDIIDGLRGFLNKHEKYSSEEVLDFIHRRFGPFDENSDWMTCNCFWFAQILNDRFPGGRLYYDVVVGHFVFEYDGVYYDYSGIVTPNDDLVAWDEFDKYDAYQKERIIRDCIR